MVARKNVRTRGKIQLSRYFKKFENGDAVAVTIERALVPNFPKRLQGRTGEIVGKRGKAQIVKIKDIAKEKTFLIEPVHLKKIKRLASQ